MPKYSSNTRFKTGKDGWPIIRGWFRFSDPVSINDMAGMQHLANWIVWFWRKGVPAEIHASNMWNDPVVAAVYRKGRDVFNDYRRADIDTLHLIRKDLDVKHCTV